MANFGSPDFSGLRQPFPGQIFGPRHSSPNITGANSPIPPNIGPIPTVPPPGVAGPHLRLFNPIAVPQFPIGASAVTGLPWGAGVLPVATRVPVSVPPPQTWIGTGQLQPQLQIPVANQISPVQQIDQSERQKSPSADEKKHDHKHRHKHKHERKHSHHDDKHREKKHHREKKKSPRKSHHHEHGEKKKSSRSRHGGDKNLERDHSNSSHGKKRKHSPGSKHKERSDRHSRGAVLIEDRDEDRIERGSHRAVLLEDRNEDRSERGSHRAVLLEDRDEDRSERGSHRAVLLDDRDEDRIERGSHRAILLEDRDEERSERGSHRTVLLDDRDEQRNERGSHRAVLLDDRDEVQSERGSYRAVLLDDRDEVRSERGSHHAVLIEDRDSEFEIERDVELRSDYEDGEIYDDEPYETTYSEDQYVEDERRYERHDRDRRDRLGSERDVKINSRERRNGRHENYLDDLPDADMDVRNSLRERARDREDQDLMDRFEGDRNVRKSDRERKRDGRHNWHRDNKYPECRDNRNLPKNSEREQYKDNRQIRGSRSSHSKKDHDFSKEDELYRHNDKTKRDRLSRYDNLDGDGYISQDSFSRYDRLSRAEEPLRNSDNETQYDRNIPRSERGVRGSRGHSGAILREDRDDGPILKEEREHPTRHSAVLIEDGVEFDDRLSDERTGRHRAQLVDDRRESRDHALLLDDREEVRDHSRSQENRKDYRGHLSKHLDERRDNRDRHSEKRHFESDRTVDKDREIEKKTRNFDRDRRIDEKERLDDRAKTKEKLHRADTISTRRGGRIEKEVTGFVRDRDDRTGYDKGKGSGTGRYSDDFAERKCTGPVSRNWTPEEPLDTKTGRTGAVLIEDRESNKRDMRCEVSTSGALLIEDVDVDEDRSSDRSLRGHETSFRGQSQRGLSRTDSRTNVTRQSQEKLSGVQRSKRSRSSSVSRQEVRLKRGRGSSEREEPENKKRRIWEPGPNDVSTTKCIRSGSPAVPGNDDEMDTEPIAAWVRCSAADLYFTKDPKTGNMVTTKRMRDLEERFDRELVQRTAMVRALQEPYERELPKPNWKNQCGGHSHHHDHSDSENECSSSSSSSSDSESDSEEWWMEEMKFKQQNPYRLHSEIWYNDPNELNYGPLCRCSNKAKTFGIRHSIYPGEEPLPQCDLNSNNLDKLYHYRITVSPAKNFIISQPTVIMFDGHEYLFEGFSIFSHKPIPKWPDCQVIRFNIIYTIHVVEEQVPENFSVQSLDSLTEYLFDEILELVDIDWRGPGGESHCRRFHVMPRFARPFPENGKELLSMNDVLLYLLKSSKQLLEPSELKDMYELDNENWTKYVDSFRHMVVTCPGKRPSSIRIDQLDRSDCNQKGGELKMPFIIHHGVRPPQLSYAGDPIYKKKWREYMKFRHLLWSRARISAKEREKLYELEVELEKIRMKCTMKREITVAVSSEGFLKTGIRADICQHAMLLPVLFEHLRFHECLSALEKSIGYHFRDRSLLQLAMTHSSYKINYGTNPDHGRNSLSNCGFRQLEFGDHKAVTQHTRKRGLNVLLRIMAKMGHKEEKRSEIPHNERLEFLGDAVVEFVTSTHLYNMFPQASEGELTLYRGSLVNNNHLSVLADKLRLQDFLLYAHGPDLCHDSNLKHAMANCFEALMGALFLDGGIELADIVFSRTCFPEEDLSDSWLNTPKHPLIADEPNGDRHWIAQSHVLQKLASFEDDIGYEFRHIRLLAKAFTQRNVGYNNLTYGHNQRLEFLGDTIMQLICSEYLFKHFPDHHEGHLTLLRSSLVNNKTQSTVATELGMPDFVIKANMTKVDEKPQNYSDLKTKEKADLLEALYGALYVDGGLEPCQILTDVCFFPRLEDFILDQEWNDPKSQLQQCCLTLREMNDESPDIPIYKVIRKYGPTNQRKYMVAVYFREKRLAVGTAGSKQQAEMYAAETALKNSKGLFHKNVYPPPKSKLKQMAPVKEEMKEEPD